MSDPTVNVTPAPKPAKERGKVGLALLMWMLAAVAKISGRVVLRFRLRSRQSHRRAGQERQRDHPAVGQCSPDHQQPERGHPLAGLLDRAG